MRHENGFWISWIILILLMFVLVVLFVRSAPAQENTNDPEIRAWFAGLTNRMGGSCCGEGDAYPAYVTKMPRVMDEEGRESYRSDGEAVIVDPSAKTVYQDGIAIKNRPALHGDLHVQFSWMKMTREKHGNPFDHALVFVGASMDGTIENVYCVVILPMGS